MRGRKPVPTRLKVLHGNPGGRKLNIDEPVPREPLADAPETLTEEQAESWRYVMRHAPPGLLRSLDRTLLTLWVQHEERHARAAAQVAEMGDMVKFPGIPMPMPNPYLRVMNQQALILIKLASEMGFTPASRARVASASAEGHPVSSPASVPLARSKNKPLPLDQYLASAPPVPVLH